MLGILIHDNIYINIPYQVFRFRCAFGVVFPIPFPHSALLFVIFVDWSLRSSDVEYMEDLKSALKLEIPRNFN